MSLIDSNEVRAEANDPPLVSVITPTFNRASLLAEAIDSVLQQTYPNWELIIWDDGSTDATPSLAGKHADPRIRWYGDINRGKCHALNRSLAKARGEFVAILDDDDIWRPDKLRRQVESMVRHPHIDVLFTNFENLHLANGVLSVSFEANKSVMAQLRTAHLGENVHFIKDGLWAGLLPLNIILPSATLVRKAACDANGPFNAELRSSEDLEYWFRMALAGARFAYLDEVLALRRKSAGSLSNQGEVSLLGNIRALGCCLEQAQTTGREDVVRVVKKATGVAWEQLVRFYLAQGRPTRALDAFRRRCHYGITGRAVALAACGLFGPASARLFRRPTTDAGRKSADLIGSVAPSPISTKVHKGT